MIRKNVLILFCLFLFSIPEIYGFQAELNPKSAEEFSRKRPHMEEYCFDFTETLPGNLVHEINIQGGSLKRAFDIDFVVVIIPSLEDRGIVDYTVGLFSNWQIGESTKGKKGMLILIAKEEQKIKMEVGYDLEHVFTDAYIGYVQRDMLKSFLEQADWERGFLGTIEIMADRIYRMYKKGVDVEGISSDGALTYYSEGAGAKTVFEWGSALKRPVPETPQELREYFGAQPSPELAFQRYMEFNARDMRDYTLDMFSDKSKEFFSNWRVSSAQRREEVESVNGLTYITRIKGRYAALIGPFNSNPNEFISQCPHFFIRTEKGWQIDIDAMARSLIMAGPTWHFLSVGHPYMFAFKDYVIAINRCYPKQGQKAYLGLSYAFRNTEREGFKVAPELGSPAKKGGIKNNDILISIDGEKITRPYQDWEMMKRYSPGDVVEIVVKRDGRKIKLNIPVGEPKSYTDEMLYSRKEGDPWLGIYYGYSEPYERDIDESFIGILYVVEGSPAERAGLKDGDLITYLPGAENEYELSSDFHNMLKRVKPGDRVTIGVLRNLKESLKFEVEVGSYSAGKEGF